MNLPHSHVVVVGDRHPRWFVGGGDKVTFLELPRLVTRFDDSQTSVLRGLAYLADEGVDWSYICHDDIFVVHPVDWVGPCVRGPLPFMVARMARNQYYKRADQARRWLLDRGVAKPWNYNVHVPFLCRNDLYLQIAEEAKELIAGYRASLYGNLLRLPARVVPDPKITSHGVTPNARMACWSMGDGAWEKGVAGKLVRRQFVEPAPWEF